MHPFILRLKSSNCSWKIFVLESTYNIFTLKFQANFYFLQILEKFQNSRTNQSNFCFIPSWKRQQKRVYSKSYTSPGKYLKGQCQELIYCCSLMHQRSNSIYGLHFTACKNVFKFFIIFSAFLKIWNWPTVETCRGFITRAINILKMCSIK